MLTDAQAVRLTHSQLTDARVSGNTAEHACGAIVVTRHGCRIQVKGDRFEIPSKGTDFKSVPYNPGIQEAWKPMS